MAFISVPPRPPPTPWFASRSTGSSTSTSSAPCQPTAAEHMQSDLEAPDAQMRKRMSRARHWILTPPDTDRFRFCFKEPNAPACTAIPDAEQAACKRGRKKTNSRVSYSVEMSNPKQQQGDISSPPAERKDVPPIWLERICIAPPAPPTPTPTPLDPTVHTDASTPAVTLVGHCTVANLAFQKHVTARYTLDDWATYTDVDAAYEASLAGCDHFVFRLPVNVANHHFKDDDDPGMSTTKATTMQLALCYRVDGIEYWDSNGGDNYHIQVIKSITVEEDDDNNDNIADEDDEQPAAMWTQKDSPLVNDTHINPWTTSPYWIPGYMRYSHRTFGQNSYTIEFLQPEKPQDHETEPAAATPDDRDTLDQHIRPILAVSQNVE